MFVKFIIFPIVFFCLLLALIRDANRPPPDPVLTREVNRLDISSAGLTRKNDFASTYGTDYIQPSSPRDYTYSQTLSLQDPSATYTSLQRGFVFSIILVFKNINFQ
jgi:hypothetical protein